MGCIIVSDVYASDQLSQASDVEVISSNRFVNAPMKTLCMIAAGWHAENGSSPESLFVPTWRNDRELFM
jgi:hypothetical protein